MTRNALILIALSMSLPAYAGAPELCSALRQVAASIMVHRQLGAEKEKLVDYWKEKTTDSPISLTGGVTEHLINDAYTVPQKETDEEIKAAAKEFAHAVQRECLSSE